MKKVLNEMEVRFRKGEDNGEKREEKKGKEGEE